MNETRCITGLQEEGKKHRREKRQNTMLLVLATTTVELEKTKTKVKLAEQEIITCSYVLISFKLIIF